MRVNIFLLFCVSASVAQNVTTSVTSSTSAVSNGTTTPISSTSTTTPKPTTITTTTPPPPTKITTTTPPPPAPLEESTTHKPKALKLGPVVTIKSGQLRPLVLTSRKGREYYAFRGVPYANPPITFQRFKAPSPIAPWEGVLNATKFAPPCIQYNLLIDEIEGEEDCLHINIMSPKLGNKAESGTKFPVIVFIHQGAFMFGSAADYEAKYMMDNDVVLVTIAYRLGSFGFLNTEGGSDAYGNMGLKDQILALKWIQDNIEAFNGEKNLVTIVGESAGGASVHYHLLSDKSKGLFSRAVSMSGTALSPWAFTRNPRKNAVKLGTMLNCPTTVMYELFICLQGVNATDLAKQHKAFFEWGSDPVAPFAPSVEITPDEEGVFIKNTPYKLMQNGHINDNVPWVLGVVDDVCLLDAWSILNDPQLIGEMNIDWNRISPLTYTYRDTALEPDAVSNQIRAFYFGSKTIGNETAHNLTNLYSDRLFNHGMRTSALLHGKYNEAVPIYLYTVGYKGQQSHLKFLGISEYLGVSEGDELQYLFNMGRFDEIGRGHPDEEFSDNFIKLWVSFAREGKPSATWNGPEWNRMSLQQVKGDEALLFYRISGNSSTFVPEPFSERMSFWDNLPLNENDKEVQSPIRRSDLSSMDDI